MHRQWIPGRFSPPTWPGYEATVRDEDGVAGEGGGGGGVGWGGVGEPKFHSWGEYTMTLTNVQRFL